MRRSPSARRTGSRLVRHERVASRPDTPPHRHLRRHLRPGPPRPPRRRRGGPRDPGARPSRLHARRAAAAQARPDDLRTRRTACGCSNSRSPGGRSSPSPRAISPPIAPPTPSICWPTCTTVWGEGHTLFFVMGEDSLRDFPDWRAPERIAALAQLAVVTRPNVAVEVDAIIRAVPGPRRAHPPRRDPATRHRLARSPRHASPPIARSPIRCRKRSSGTSTNTGSIASTTPILH